MNKRITKLFLTQLINKLNESLSFSVYYEKALTTATFPYGVIPTLTLNTLDYGYNCIFDIELYLNELSNISVEDLCDELRNILDGYSYADNNISFHINFDDQILTKQSEQDLTYRRVSFAARIF